MKSHLLFVFGVMAVLFFTVPTEVNAQSLGVVPYMSVGTYPIDVKNCGDDRLFIADKNGFIRIINSDGTVRSTPFLDISSKMVAGSEDGLMGIVFSPNYKTDGKFYVDYIGLLAGDTTSFVEQYKVNAADSNIADVSSELTLLTQSQLYNDHVGGNLMFGKDGYLYINFGDGDLEQDPHNFAQNLTTFDGKILRIDITNSSVAQPYSIPATNAFYNSSIPGIKKEIWAFGVRNPFRSSIDRLTGDFWIGDVGQYYWEEVDFQGVNEVNGQNYGWNIIEGDSCFLATSCDTAGLKMPLYVYPHTNMAGAIIGGYVSRSPESKSLFGTYLFADLTSKWVEGLSQVNGQLAAPPVRFITGAQAPGYPISFGEDKFGDLYMLYNANAMVYKLQDTSYLRHPKAYITPTAQDGGTSYLLQGLQGRNLTYQWLRNNVAIAGATLPDYTVSSNGNYSLVVTNSLGFSDTSDVFPFGALPLSLISFTAQKLTAAKIGLQWQTASEQNIDGYNILRKESNEINFSKIGFVQSKSANGISSGNLNYTFIDSLASSHSTLFYQLQVLNKDGHFTYSDIRTIAPDAGNSVFTFYPNPAKSKLYINLNGYSGPAVLIMYDNSGQKVKEQTINVQTSTINLTGLRGFYIVQVSGTNGQNLVREKLIIQ